IHRQRLALGLGFCLLAGTSLSVLWVYAENWLPVSYVPYYLSCPEIFPTMMALSCLCHQQHEAALQEGEATPARGMVTVPPAQAAGAQAHTAADTHTLVSAHRLRGDLQPRASAAHLPATEPDHWGHGVCRGEVHLHPVLPGVSRGVLHAWVPGTLLHLH
uniref:Globoside alpha-1,3-N-acetylgalactosaminyltransferase 1 (FORS blood group) n=1 Tax=Rhinopithecus bieti TaxID=61621 RepID=A0A2K6KXL6_RHIBE